MTFISNEMGIADNIRKDDLIFLPLNLSTFQHLQLQSLLLFLLQWMQWISLFIPSCWQYHIVWDLLKDFTPLFTFFTPDYFLSHLHYLFLLFWTVSQEHTIYWEIFHLINTLYRCHVIFCFLLLQLPFHFFALLYKQLLKILNLLSMSASLLSILFFFLRPIMKYFRPIKRISKYMIKTTQEVN